MLNMKENNSYPIRFHIYLLIVLILMELVQLFIGGIVTLSF